MFRIALLAPAVASVAVAAYADPDPAAVDPVSNSVGEMGVPMAGGGIDRSQVDNALRFEPIQSFDELFLRDDVVYLMRHGPTDWDELDVKNVAPTDCDNQRVLSEEGREHMRDLGALFAFNDIKFGKIFVSEWCRNQQTLEELEAGYDEVKPNIWGDIAVETLPSLNLLLSLQGAPNVSRLRELVSNWDGGQGDGPALVISHFTNIQELTEFAVYEGEALVLDPKQNNRVLGYLRLKTASPDVGHFSIEEQDAIYNEDGSMNEEAAVVVPKPEPRGAEN